MNEQEALILKAITEFGKTLQQNQEFQEALEQSAGIRKVDRMMGTAKLISLVTNLSFRAGYDFAYKEIKDEQI